MARLEGSPDPQSRAAVRLYPRASTSIAKIQMGDCVANLVRTRRRRRYSTLRDTLRRPASMPATVTWLIRALPGPAVEFSVDEPMGSTLGGL